jgi:hypothetical protein
MLVLPRKSVRYDENGMVTKVDEQRRGIFEEKQVRIQIGKHIDVGPTREYPPHQRGRAGKIVFDTWAVFLAVEKRFVERFEFTQAKRNQIRKL